MFSHFNESGIKLLFLFPYIIYSYVFFGVWFDSLVQAGLTKDNPTINFLEDYTEVVLQRNIESLFACGGVLLFICTHISFEVWNLINSYSLM